MMVLRISLMILLLVAAGVAPLAAGNQVSQATQKSYPRCGLEMYSNLTQGQPVVLRFTYENTAYEPSVLDLDYDREGAFHFKLRRPDGSSVALPRKTIREGVSRVGIVTIPPQGSHSQQIILDDWYEFSELGKYSVSLTVLKSSCLGPLELDFEIRPFDIEHLQNVCSRLADEVRKNKDNYEKSSDAAKVLAKVDNPIVVPFLVKALEANQMLDTILVPALERIGDKHAVNSLISLLGRHESESLRYELVRPALVRLEQRSSFEQAEAIRIALARFPAP